MEPDRSWWQHQRPPLLSQVPEPELSLPTVSTYRGLNLEIMMNFVKIMLWLLSYRKTSSYTFTSCSVRFHMFRQTWSFTINHWLMINYSSNKAFNKMLTLFLMRTVSQWWFLWVNHHVIKSHRGRMNIPTQTFFCPRCSTSCLWILVVQLPVCESWLFNFLSRQVRTGVWSRRRRRLKLRSNSIVFRGRRSLRPKKLPYELFTLNFLWSNEICLFI